jgi:putative membrane protein
MSTGRGTDGAATTPGEMSGDTMGSSSSAAGFGTSADKDFAKKAVEGGNAEVALGKLAQQKSNSADVKQFGQRMVTDHTKMNEEMTGIAQNLGVTPPSGTATADKAIEARLKSKSGDDFDKAYIEDMVKDHCKDLAEFKKEAASATDPQMKKAAAHGTTVISEHLRMAEDLAKSHNVDVASK